MAIRTSSLIIAATALLLSSARCDQVRLLGPSVLEQLNPRVA